MGFGYQIGKVIITRRRSAKDAVENGILSKAVRGSLRIR